MTSVETRLKILGRSKNNIELILDLLLGWRGMEKERRSKKRLCIF